MTYTDVSPGTRAPATPRRAGRGDAGRFLAAGWLAHLALRLWLVWGQASPAAYPDEAGYLAAARLLAGGVGADLSGTTFYQGGYPLLLVPAFWITKDPEAAYQLTLITNAVVGSAAFPLAYRALRVLRLDPARACVLACAVATFPAALYFSQYALVDAVFPVVALGWLLSLHAFLAGPARRTAGARPGAHGPLGGAGAGAGAGSSLLAAYAAAAHARGLVLLAVHVVVLLAVLARRWAPRRAALAALGAAVAGGAAAKVLNAVVLAALYPSGSLDLGRLLVTRLTGLAGQAWALGGAAGQLWYLVVSTWGLAGAGMVAAVAVAVRRGSPRALRICAAALLLVTAGVAYASSAALPDEHRVGNFAYGRYTAFAAVALAAAGAAALVRAPRRTAVAITAGAGGVLAAAGGAAAWHAGDRLRDHQFIAFDFPETSFLTGDWSALDMPGASARAFAVLTVLTCARLLLGGSRRGSPARPRPGSPSRRGPEAGARAGLRVPAGLAPRLGAAAVALAVLAVNGAAAVTLTRQKGWAETPILRGLPERGGVAVSTGVFWATRIRLIQQVSWTRVRRFDPRTAAPPPGACAVVVPWPGAAPAGATWPAAPPGWRVAGGRDQGRQWGIVVWRAPVCGSGPSALS
ncbi:hypothetical protein [Bailinhaonella thermotolerans]|uniref:Glycosyltransferase RgtA/B/C/D-like domain-containing protein n=1 Tax=Bailinhaonella thermotolerans TaxID=1070861 RepID=A0A3A4B139_9ACTN|nr:hypothetical protein [Bailinhaonella thermotolerans]RJL34549.1 hypothetical protein D5H75_09090 [Bailinhaonella thermotolerans]